MKKTIPIIMGLATTVVFGAGFQLEQICNGSGALTATEVEIAKKFPIGDCDALGKSRGGNLDDIDAINDGMGSVVLAPMGQNISSTQAKMRNTKFIEAVREHGAKAKDGSKGVVAYLNDNSIDTEALVREADANEGELAVDGPVLTNTYATATIVSEAYAKLAPGKTMDLADLINNVPYKGTSVNWQGLHSLNGGAVDDIVYFGGKTVKVGNLVTGRHFYLNGISYPTNGFELYSSEDGQSWSLEYSTPDIESDSYTHVMDFDTKYLRFKSVGHAPDGYWRFFKNTMKEVDYVYIPLPRWDIKEYSE